MVLKYKACYNFPGRHGLRLSFFIFIIPVFFSCATNKIRTAIEIPFSLINDRIIVDAVVNGRSGSFVFDTGTTESYFDVDANNLLPVAYTKTTL